MFAPRLLVSPDLVPRPGRRAPWTPTDGFTERDIYRKAQLEGPHPARLPGGSVTDPGRTTRQADEITQAGHGRTVGPVPAVRAREGGLCRPGPVMAGAVLVTSPSGMLPGPRQHAARLRGWRVPAPAVERASWAIPPISNAVRDRRLGTNSMYENLHSQC
jgi:hypothetical protein